MKKKKSIVYGKGAPLLTIPLSLLIAPHNAASVLVPTPGGCGLGIMDGRRILLPSPLPWGAGTAAFGTGMDKLFNETNSELVVMLPTQAPTFTFVGKFSKSNGVFD